MCIFVQCVFFCLVQEFCLCIICFDDQLNCVLLIIFLGIFLVIVVIFCFYDLDRISLWYDEVVSWSQFNGMMVYLLVLVLVDNYLLFYNIFLWMMIFIFGDGEIVLWFLLIILGLFVVWLIYLIGCWIGGYMIGFLVVVFLVFLLFYIWYLIEVCMYVLFVVIGFFFLWSLLRFFDWLLFFNVVVVIFSMVLFFYSYIYVLFGVVGVGLVCFGYVFVDLCWVCWKVWLMIVIVCCVLVGGGFLFLFWLIILFGCVQLVVLEGFWIVFLDVLFFWLMIKEIVGLYVVFLILVVIVVVVLFFVLNLGNVEFNWDRELYCV